MHERFTMYEVKDAINYLKRETGCKNVNAFVKDVVNALYKMNQHSVISVTDVEATELREICHKHNIHITTKELLRNVLELIHNVITESIVLSETFILNKWHDCFNDETNFKDLLNGMVGINCFEFPIYDLTGEHEYPFKVVVTNVPEVSYIVVSFDMIENGIYRHYPTLYVDKETRLCYFKHYDEEETYRDTYTLKGLDSTDLYFRCNLNSICKKYIKDPLDFTSSHYADCHVYRLLPCIAAYYEIEKAKKVKTRFRKEEKVREDIRGKVKVSEDISFTKMKVEPYVIEKVTTLESLLVQNIREKKEYKGGHHASPIPHDRRGFYRRLPHSTDRIWIEATRVKSPNYTGPANIVLKSIQV